MAKNFWQKLKKPIICLAPMADVTDAAFRVLITKLGKPDVIFTEFVSCDGLCSQGKKNLLINLKYSTKERPIVAQIFGSKPENFYQTAKLIKKLKFDGIDINMGCPDKKIEKQGAGADLINPAPRRDGVKNTKLAQEIIQATKRGAGELPVSVKTRIGYNKITTTKWIKALLKAEPAVITIHWRTRKEMSKVPAHWEEAKKVMKLAQETNTLIIGNGDVQNLSDAHDKARKYGVDGVMIGRAVLGKPWLFRPLPSPPLSKEREPNLKERLKIMIKHAELFEKYFKNTKNFAIMRKHFGAYLKGLENTKELKIKLMQANNVSEVKEMLKKYL